VCLDNDKDYYDYGSGGTADDMVSSCVVHKVPKILSPGTKLTLL
jgi:hypothetical protein